MAQTLYQHWFVDFGPFQKGEFIESELGPIPVGWEAGVLEDLFVLQRGFDLPAQDRIQGRHPIFAASGFNGTHIEYKVKGPGVVTGRSGKLGNVFYVPMDFWPLNTSLWIKEYKTATPLYAYHFLQRLGLESFNSGSAVPTLNRNDVHGLPVPVPPKQVVQSFEQYVSHWFKLRQQNEEENAKLASIRDYLLPKLLSGEVPVLVAEEMVA
jgi:type I restriction enzyme S subunit